MNPIYSKKVLTLPFIVLSIFILFLCGYIVSKHFYYGLIILIVGILLILTLAFVMFKQLQNNEQAIQHIHTKVEEHHDYAISHLPFGLILLSKDQKIYWMNEFMKSYLNDEYLNHDINEVFTNINSKLKLSEDRRVDVNYGEYNFEIIQSTDEFALYIFDRTNEFNLNEQLEHHMPIIGTLFLDNYDDVTHNMSDSERSQLNSRVTNEINRWASENNTYVKRFSNDRFLLVLNALRLKDIEHVRFNILDIIREQTTWNNQVTLSIGIGEGTTDLVRLGELSQSALDLALGRGGDQVAIKNDNGNIRFYGGKTDPMEKRTRVKARVVSHALRDILLEGDNVLIMGHKGPDMDAIGAAIGVSRIARLNDLESYIVLNDEDIDATLSRVMEEINEKEELSSQFITSDRASQLINDRTTLVIVDTHKPDMVIDPKLLKKAKRKVVIDHHRRGEEFIDNPLLVYMEPYASSTAELVTELFEYQPKDKKISRLEATVMLAGIIVDTRNFTLRTGSRTFDAASYLRSHGADTILCQEFLKDDLKTYMRRSEIIQTVDVHDNGAAIAHGDVEEIYHPVTVAQAADELLSIDGVKASFVVAKRSNNVVGISARSLGDVNVQLIMEDLGGGGHLSNAATQMKDVTVEEAIESLQEVVSKHLEGEEEE